MKKNKQLIKESGQSLKGTDSKQPNTRNAAVGDDNPVVSVRNNSLLLGDDDDPPVVNSTGDDNPVIS